MTTKMSKHEVRLGWVRQTDGTYRCDLEGHRYEISRGIVFPWVVCRDGIGTEQANTLTEAKRAGVRIAQRDNGVEPEHKLACDISDLTGEAWPWLVVCVASRKDPEAGRWYAMNTRNRACLPCADRSEAVAECNRLNGE